MAITTLRPVASVVSTMIVTGGASANIVLADDSDASYITAPYPGFSQTIVSFSGFTLPSGTTIKQVRFRVRYVTVTPGVITLWYVRMEIGTLQGPVDTYQTIAGPSPVDAVGAWRATAPDGSAWTQAAINSLWMDIYPGLYTGNVQMPQIFEAYLDVETNTNPVATISSPTNGGTVTTTTKPPTVFAYADTADNDPMEAYRIRIFSSTQYGAGGFDPNTSVPYWDSGRISATLPPGSGVPPTIDLVNTVTYRSYVWVYQQGATTALTGLGVSVPVYTQFTMNVTPPAAPTLVASAGVGFIGVTVTSGGGSPATSTVSLERSIDGGATWVIVRGSPQTPGVFLDIEVPPNRSVTYRARAYTAGGVVGPYSSSTAPLVLVDNDWRLKDPISSAYNIVLNILGTSMKTNRPEDKAFFSALGRTRKIGVTDVIKGEEGTLVLEFESEVAFLAFEAIRARQETMLLVRGWTGDQWYITFGQNEAIEVFSTTPVYRTISIDWVEVDAP